MQRSQWRAFVFDMMEPERPKMDAAVLAFLRSEALHPADFTIRGGEAQYGVGEAGRRAGCVDPTPMVISEEYQISWPSR